MDYIINSLYFRLDSPATLDNMAYLSIVFVRVIRSNLSDISLKGVYYSTTMYVDTPGGNLIFGG